MLESLTDPIAREDSLDQRSAATPERTPEQASSYTCPHCSFVNWCTFDSGHSGQCHCDQGHYWDGNH
jgi:hypothetical protein